MMLLIKGLESIFSFYLPLHNFTITFFIVMDFYYLKFLHLELLSF